jgi:DNA-binding NarL/FixJ family response regulator
VLTLHEDPGYARAALNAGAKSFVLKRAEPDEILRAFRAVATRGSYVDPRPGAKLADAESDVPLSVRQREVVRHIALGHQRPDRRPPVPVRTHDQDLQGEGREQARVLDAG